MDIPVKKNNEYIVDIIDNGFEGEGIAKIDNFTIFIPNAIKGEKVKILIVKVLSYHAFGKILEILETSENRIVPDCATFKRCGGCNLRHIKYEETLKMKQNAVQSLVNKTLKRKVKVLDTIGMECPLYYRNKAQYPVGMDKNNVPQIGVFANRTHEIIPIQKCMIQDEKSQEIAKTIFDFWNKAGNSIYNEETGNGLLRHIVIKVGFKTQEVMCVLVINGKNFPKEKELVEYVTSKYPEVKTIVKNINMKNTNVILGVNNINIFGDGYITDKLGDYTFKISPLSFYQVNPIQAEKLYNIGVDLAKINNDDIVFDLYCGIGTISLFMAKYAKKVYGIEIVEQAIENAKENSKLNGVDNVEFIAGDAEVVLDDLINNKCIIPDVVMVDPPRKGLDNRSIENILKIKPRRVVYISCNPASLMRDLAKFEEFYDIGDIQPVDMFPYTSHTESISVLKLKQ